MKQLHLLECFEKKSLNLEDVQPDAVAGKNEEKECNPKVHESENTGDFLRHIDHSDSCKFKVLCYGNIEIIILIIINKAFKFYVSH